MQSESDEALPSPGETVIPVVPHLEDIDGDGMPDIVVIPTRWILGIVISGLSAILAAAGF